MDDNSPQETGNTGGAKPSRTEKTRLKLAQLQAQYRRQLAAEKESLREKDNRECALLGVLTKRYFMPRDPELWSRYLKAADAFFWRDGDRQTFGLSLLDEAEKKKRRRGHWDSDDTAANDTATLKQDFQKETA